MLFPEVTKSGVQKMSILRRAIVMLIVAGVLSSAADVFAKEVSAEESQSWRRAVHGPQSHRVWDTSE
jgi:hypothetical protein